MVERIGMEVVINIFDIRRLPRGNGNLHALKNEKLPTRISRDTVIPSKRNTGSIQLM